MSPDIDAEDIRRFIVRGTGSQMGANESVKDLLDAIKTVVDAILVDSGTTLEAKLDAIKTVVDAVLVDTGTTLEAKLDAIEGSGFATGTDSLKILSDMLDTIRTELTYQHQTDAALSQANPTVNTYYTILNTTPNARLIQIIVAVATTGETLQVKVTIDGKTMTTAGFAATAGTSYYIFIRSADHAADALTYSSTAALVAFYDSLEGRSVKVEVQKTTTNGTGTLSGRVVYGKR